MLSSTHQDKQRNRLLVAVDTLARVVANLGANLRHHVEKTAMAFIVLGIDIKLAYRDTSCNTSLAVCLSNK